MFHDILIFQVSPVSSKDEKLLRTTS